MCSLDIVTTIFIILVVHGVLVGLTIGLLDKHLIKESDPNFLFFSMAAAAWPISLPVLVGYKIINRNRTDDKIPVATALTAPKASSKKEKKK